MDLDKVNWLTIDESHLSEYHDPANVGRIPEGRQIPDMMLKGELAAAILGVDMPKDPRVRTLVPDDCRKSRRCPGRGEDHHSAAGMGRVDGRVDGGFEDLIEV